MAAPTDENQVRAIVGGLGGGTDEREKAARLYRAIGRQAKPHQWLWLGLDGEGHFRRRALGQQSRLRSGDLFRGRQAALRVAFDWMTEAKPPGRPLVVTGQPGAGKSAFAGRLALMLANERSGLGASIHCHGASYSDFLIYIAQRLGIRDGANLDQIIDALLEYRGDVLLFIVDAIDEAGSRHDREQIAVALMELAALPRARVLAVTRPQAIGDRYRSGSLLSLLNVTADSSAALIDLDDDRYFDHSEMINFVSAMLRQEGALHPGPVGCAWETYRADATLTSLLAAVVARRAGRNHLVAALAATQLTVGELVADPRASGFSEASIPSRVGEALTKYLDTLSGNERLNAHALLTALAFAHGHGLDDSLWLRFCTALGHPAPTSMVDDLRRTSAIDYLIETVGGGRSRRTRLFHQALADELKHGRDLRTDEAQLLHVLLPMGGDWRVAEPYALEHAVDHAAGAGQLPLLLADDSYLLHADLHRLLEVSERELLHKTNDRLDLLRLTPQARSAQPTMRAAYFSVTEAVEQLGDSFSTIAGLPFRAAWAFSNGRVRCLDVATGHAEHIQQIHVAEVLGRPTILLAAADNPEGLTRLVDPVSGDTKRTLRTGIPRGMFPIRCDDRDLHVIWSEDEARLWDLVAGRMLRTIVAHDATKLHAVGHVRYAGKDRLYTVSEGRTLELWDDGAQAVQYRFALPANEERWIICDVVSDLQADTLLLRLWDQLWRWNPATDTKTLLVERGVNRVEALDLGTDRALVIATNGAGLWLTAAGGPVQLQNAPDDFTDICAIDTVEGPVIASALAWGQVGLWNARDGSLRHEVEVGFEEVWLLSAETDGTDPVIIAATDLDVTVIDPISGNSRDLFQGTGNEITMARPFQLDGRLHVAIANDDGSTVIWQPAQGSHWDRAIVVGDLTGVWSVGIGDFQLAVCALDRGDCYLFDSKTGHLKHIIDAHNADIAAVCGLLWDGKPAIATSAPDRTIRIWDVDSGDCLSTLPVSGGSLIFLAIVETNGKEKLVGVNDVGSVSAWDPHTGDTVELTSGMAPPFNIVSTAAGTILTGSDNTEAEQSVVMFNLQTGSRIVRRHGDRSPITDSIALTVEAEPILLTSAPGSECAIAWHVGDGTIKFRLETTAYDLLSAGPTCSEIFTVAHGDDEQHWLECWDLRSGAIRELTEPSDAPFSSGMAAFGGERHPRLVLSSTFYKQLMLIDARQPWNRTTIPMPHQVRKVFPTSNGLLLWMTEGIMMLEVAS